MGDPWERVASKQLADYRFFQLRQDTNRHPRHGREFDFFIFEFPHWVNIIPLTQQREVLFIRQFRHGTRDVTCEIPGGTVDPGESPRQAALRELQEETGFHGSDAIELGWVNPNPALQENRCWTFLVEDVEEIGDRQTEGSEAIDVVRVPLADVEALFTSGEIAHALTIAAFHFYRQHLGHRLI